MKCQFFSLVQGKKGNNLFGAVVDPRLKWIHTPQFLDITLCYTARLPGDNWGGEDPQQQRDTRGEGVAIESIDSIQTQSNTTKPRYIKIMTIKSSAFFILTIDPKRLDCSFINIISQLWFNLPFRCKNEFA